jgi:LuxR family transcriptional regulator, positive regulator of biofilm formation
VVINLLIGCYEPAWGVALRDAMALEMFGACEGVVCSVNKLLDEAALLRPDVVLLERRGGQRVDALVASLGGTSPTTRVLLFCDGYSRELIVEALESCAAGCLFKASPAAVFAEAARSVYSGAPWFGREVLLEALGAQPGGAALPLPTKENKLTQREREIMLLIRAGMSNKEIARRLAISDHTVKTHLHHVYVKLHRSGRYKALLAQPGSGIDTGVLARAPLPGALDFVA